ncbi:RNA-binding protein [Nitzschia inconspicua]|uniref:RNA-binding protein n=1 Tax=Nitzschia inconspicua TaxID=303405 RepID=A0A9K3KN64_9STRA|nr:RNA-binding protein [Nitzschia inconspicua]
MEQDNSDANGSTTYEEIMGIQKSAPSAGEGNTIETSSEIGGITGATDALSKRLLDFRKWCTDEAKIKIHPSICIVNGEATDGTKNAPVFAVAPPNGLSENTAVATSTTQVAQGRLGMVDGNAERALYERTMGCQIWTAREIKKDEIMMTCPRSAMITPDLVAASDAGRAVLACCKRPEANECNFWDVFENTSICEAQVTQKVASKPGAQLLVKTLRERDLAEKTFKAATSAAITSEQHELAKMGTISSRAPFLAFLIHQRFSPEVTPPVVTDGNADLENAMDDKNNAISASRRIRPLSGTPATFGPYARTLPSSLSLPICWKRNELALLSQCIPGLQPLQETVATTTQLATEFTALLKAGILTRFPSIFAPGVVTWERWVWAAAVYTSRILPAGAYFNVGEEKAEAFSPGNHKEALQSPPYIWDELGVMVPFLDMVNHEVEAQCIRWEKNVPGDGDVMKDESSRSHLPRAVLTRRVKKQQQVYFSYGDDDFSNHKMLVQYGFAQMLNKADVARLGWGLMDAVGKVDAPSTYTSLIEDLEEDFPFLVYESSDGQAINDWWSDDRLTLLETEAFPAVENSFMSSLKMGKKMTGSARSDGLYDPILLTVSLVSTMPTPELASLMTKIKSSDGDNFPVMISQRHQRVLRSYLLFVFTRKLEKLLDNLSTGLKIHYGSLNLWTRASEGGIRHVAKESDEDTRVGWQSFFDRHAYAATMEVEKHYYALAPDSCVLTLYDGQLQALQTSIDGLLSVEKFEKGVLKQLEDLGFILLNGSSEDSSGIVQVGNGTVDSCRKDESKKKDDGKGSPKKKNRNRKRNSSNVASTGDRPANIKLHIGNLSYQTTPSDLFDFFSRDYGRDNVLECHIPAERNTGKSRGFGFVTLPEQIARQILNSGKKYAVSVDIAQDIAFVQTDRMFRDFSTIWGMGPVKAGDQGQTMVVTMTITDGIEVAEIVAVEADHHIAGVVEVKETIMNTTTETTPAKENAATTIMNMGEVIRGVLAEIVTGDERAVGKERIENRLEIDHVTDRENALGRDPGTRRSPVDDLEAGRCGDREVGQRSDVIAGTEIVTASDAAPALSMIAVETRTLLVLIE